VTLSDQVRAYWDRQPCNIRHSEQPVGSRAYFDEVEARKYFVEAHIPAFAEFERWRGRQVLDVGCGIGTDTIRFARAGAQVTALEMSHRAATITQQRAAVYGLDQRITVLGGDIERDSLRTTYDLVYAFGVLHHLSDPARALRNMETVLAPTGTLKIMVYHRWSWKNLLIHLRLAQPEAQAQCPVFRTFSRRDARALVERAGFEVERMTVEHIFPWKVSEYVRYRYVKAWPWRIVPARLFRWLEHRIGWHICITARKR
jgi:SAM-dependent methyltransferase